MLPQGVGGAHDRSDDARGGVGGADVTGAASGDGTEWRHDVTQVVSAAGGRAGAGGAYDARAEAILGSRARSGDVMDLGTSSRLLFTLLFLALLYVAFLNQYYS